MIFLTIFLISKLTSYWIWIFLFTPAVYYSSYILRRPLECDEICKFYLKFYFCGLLRIYQLFKKKTIFALPGSWKWPCHPDRLWHYPCIRVRILAVYRRKSYMWGCRVEYQGGHWRSSSSSSMRRRRRWLLEQWLAWWRQLICLSHLRSFTSICPRPCPLTASAWPKTATARCLRGCPFGPR